MRYTTTIAATTFNATTQNYTAGKVYILFFSLGTKRTKLDGVRLRLYF